MSPLIHRSNTSKEIKLTVKVVFYVQKQLKGKIFLKP